ncbi:MAG: hypothetical protein LC114_24510, partial [Bryobacterales bacterium]|nr:hypothetical protein [Bryobacterales bacterium]
MTISRLPPIRLLWSLLLFSTAFATARAEAPATPAEPTLEQRVADIEAYMNNGPRTPGVASKVAGPGPG